MWRSLIYDHHTVSDIDLYWIDEKKKKRNEKKF